MEATGTGSVSSEAYRTRFEILANQNEWYVGEKGVQLATSVKDPALDVLS